MSDLSECNAVGVSRSSFGEMGEFPMNTHYFPHPTVQAMFLLDETGDDLPTAIALALMNVRKNKEIEDDRYWIAVVEALTQRQPEN